MRQTIQVEKLQQENRELRAALHEAYRQRDSVLEELHEALCTVKSLHWALNQARTKALRGATSILVADSRGEGVAITRERP